MDDSRQWLNQFLSSQSSSDILFIETGQNLFLFKYFHKTCNDMHHKHKSICIIFSYGDIFFNWDSLPARLNSYREAWSYKKKKHKKTKAYRKSI